MNNFNGIGRLVVDPELRQTQNGTSVVRFRIAITRSFKNKQTNEYDSDFIPCQAFGSTAELISRSFRKGQRIGVSGNFQSGSYANNQGGTTYTLDLIVNNVTFLEPRIQQQNNNQNQGFGGNNMPDYNSTIDIRDEELPF